ncbi:AAA family ATPase [Clostridium sp. Ade.TY]|uniref:McrB family protein n=1 Tax=Clostridium sp. Ade.TY TaxID=1391647 RepID=UPI0003FBEEDE|nr:AAA family ATPase [Clostridium sp. Ade.TY]
MKWDTYMLGKLGDNIFVNKVESLQFDVRLISEEPYDFPENKVFTGYSSHIEKDGFIDDKSILIKEEREFQIDCFFEDRLLIFKPIKKRDNYKEKDNYSIDDVIIVKKPKIFSEEFTYKAVPVYRKESLNIGFEEFREKLLTNKWLKSIEGISKDIEDVPSMIFFDDGKTIRAIVGFDNHEYKYGMVKYSFNELYFVEEDKSWDDYFIQSPELDEIIFVETNMYYKIEKLAEFISNNNQQLEKNFSKLKNEDNNMNKEMKINEDDFIDKFIKITKNMNLAYKSKDLINFHIAMKSSNLVILAGMSGTGKSKIVQAYGKALGINEDNLNFIPVRPSWADDSDLLGYVDTMHNIYKPSDSRFIDTIISASKNKDDIYIVCLDEMNLARIEHYFSQFLSVLELDEDKRILNLYNSELEKNLYNADKYPSNILIGDNLFFVGTVNLDESTYHFSDKVLDRANVITLDQCDFKELYNLEKYMGQEIYCEKISFLEYKNMIKHKRNIYLLEREIDMLSEIHKSMNFLNKNIGIGFRIVKQIDKYIKNIPDNSILTRKDAIDIQLVQRVLTKIRGTQEQWNEFIGTYDIEKKELIDSSIMEILNRYSDISEFNNSKKYINDKARELSIYGYTL